MTAKEEVKKELERRLASREETKKEIEINEYFLESLFRRLKDGEDVVNLIRDYISPALYNFYAASEVDEASLHKA